MKKTILTTLICSIIVVGVALSGFVIYDRFLSTDNEPDNQETNQHNNNNNENNNQNNDKYFNSNTLSETSYTSKYYKKTATAYGDVSKYSNIFEYFADMKLEDIKLEYATNKVKSEEEWDTIYYRDTYFLTEKEITEFLNEMKPSQQELVGGMGGDYNSTDVYIYYNVNGIRHTTSLEAQSWYLGRTTDGNIYKIIDNNMPQNDEYDILQVANKSSKVIQKIVNRLNNK